MMCLGRRNLLSDTTLVCFLIRDLVGFLVDFHPRAIFGAFFCFPKGERTLDTYFVV